MTAVWRAPSALAFGVAVLLASWAPADESVLGLGVICAPSAGHFSIRTVRIFNDLIQQGRGEYDQSVFVPMTGRKKVHECRLGEHLIEVRTWLDKSQFGDRMCGALKGYLFRLSIDGKNVRFPADLAGGDWLTIENCIHTDKDVVATLYDDPRALRVVACSVRYDHATELHVRECTTKLLGN